MGPNYSISTACATANYAFVAAANHIRNGDADVMVVGGSEAPVMASGLGGFVACRALSTRNDEPTKASRWAMQLAAARAGTRVSCCFTSWGKHGQLLGRQHLGKDPEAQGQRIVEHTHLLARPMELRLLKPAVSHSSMPHACTLTQALGR